MSHELIRIDNIKWWINTSENGIRMPVPICPDHDLRMEPINPKVVRNGKYVDGHSGDAKYLKCEEGPHNIELPRTYHKEKSYVINRIDAKVFKGMKVLNLDDEAVPIAKEKIKSKNERYFLTAQLMESKRGIQVVIYAGEKGQKEKTQIIVEPEIKRLAFDQNNLDPNAVFTEIKAIFNDGTSHTIKQEEAVD